MADDTSAADPAPRVTRELQRYGTITIVGGGCYGSYYVRQLLRAERAGAIAWTSLVVVDRDPACKVATLPREEWPTALRVEVGEWRDCFDAYLTAADPEVTAHDAIVPSPLMPHLMADWLKDRARRRWPSRVVSVEPIGAPPEVPWQRSGDDRTHYVSFAEWMCPINCIEPARCPHTRGPRDWSMPVAIARYADAERAASRDVAGPFMFHCTHRTHGVGMIDVRDVLAADRAIAERGQRGAAQFLIGTASHCHGALQRIALGS